MNNKREIDIDKIIEDLEQTIKCIKDNKDNKSVLKYYIGKMHFSVQNILNAISNN
ncbi:MAG: hypothetical protein MJ180_01580 [Candidatus Gastranaerophilales bacterium]|nr:hypothetical protein [Candidatus Gastranaerophilales bacterium]